MAAGPNTLPIVTVAIALIEVDCEAMHRWNGPQAVRVLATGRRTLSTVVYAPARRPSAAAVAAAAAAYTCRNKFADVNPPPPEGVGVAVNVRGRRRPAVTGGSHRPTAERTLLTLLLLLLLLPRLLLLLPVNMNYNIRATSK